jgi:hypothetical protein
MTKGKTRSRKMRATDSRRVDPDEILPEYDFSHGRRNPYAQRYSAANVVELDADVARVFPDAHAVNSALRALAGIIQAHSPKKRSSARKTRNARG